MDLFLRGLVHATEVLAVVAHQYFGVANGKGGPLSHEPSFMGLGDAEDLARLPEGDLVAGVKVLQSLTLDADAVAAKDHFEAFVKAEEAHLVE